MLTRINVKNQNLQIMSKNKSKFKNLQIMS